MKLVGSLQLIEQSLWLAHDEGSFHQAIFRGCSCHTLHGQPKHNLLPNFRHKFGRREIVSRENACDQLQGMTKMPLTAITTES